MDKHKVNKDLLRLSQQNLNYSPLEHDPLQDVNGIALAPRRRRRGSLRGLGPRQAVTSSFFNSPITRWRNYGNAESRTESRSSAHEGCTDFQARSGVRNCRAPNS